ncbi:MAG: protein kinase [Gammaproteobacteria bacterium]|nr:protein kinase [Gammaproteobacteria bacterium]
MAGNNQQAPITPVVSIPGYKIMEVLGKGGMAVVYLAIQESIGRNVALKILAPDHTDETFSDRFLREARIVSQLTHPNIITIYDAGVQQGYHYMSMEYVPGKNLTEARDALTRKQKVGVIKQIALALDYAGKKGYVHRDIKPENIMLHEDGRAILTDFGIARDQGVSRGLTQTGKAIGTPYFMSPEQTKGLTVDHRSDIYSLGVVLFQAVAGHVPFDGPSLVAIGIKHISEPIPSLPPGMEIFQPIINKCMSKEPDHRYQSASELFNALDAISEVQLDFIDAKAKAWKSVPISHQSQTMAEQPSVELLASTGEQAQSTSRPVPKIRAQRVSTQMDITETAEFKKLARRRRRGMWLILLIALGGLAYYQQAWLRDWWQHQAKPLLAQYLPALRTNDTTVANTNTPAATPTAQDQIAKTDDTPVTAQADNTAPLSPAPTPPAEKTPREVASDVQLYKDKLRINPDDADARAGIEQARRWLHDKLETALAAKDPDTARQILGIFKRSFPRLARLDATGKIEQRIQQLEAYNTHLAKARVYMAANAVAKPEGANALEEYLAASRYFPADPSVQQGLNEIARYFYDKAKTAQTENKLADAVQYVTSGLQAVANDPSLTALKTELDTGIRQEQQINQLLQEADTLMRRDQVIDPANANAYAVYRKIQQLSPQNPAALAGMQQVQLWLLSHSQALYDEQQYLPARDLLKRAQGYFPESNTFTPLQTKIDKAIDATYPKVTHIEFSATPISALSGHGRLDKLAPGQILYAGFAFKNFYEASTTLVAQLKDTAGQTVFDEQTIQVNGRNGEGFFALHLPNPGSRDGSYSVELYMSNVRILKATLSGLH